MTDNTPPHLSRMRLVIDRIIPADADPGALDLGADRYVVAQLAGAASAFAGDIAVGLDTLDIGARLKFGTALEALSAEQIDAVLADVEQQPWFLALAELTAEGFYADPANGGNAGARSWEMIGYQHRLPDGPNGPPSATALSAAPRRRV